MTYPLDEADWANLQKAPVRNYMAGVHSTQSEIKNAGIVTDNRKWHKTSLALTGSCFFWQHEKEICENCYTVLHNRPSPPLSSLHLPVLNFGLRLFFRFMYRTTDSGFPFSLDKGVIRVVWVMPVHLWCCSVQLSVGLFWSSDQQELKETELVQRFDLKVMKKMCYFSYPKWLIETQ